MRKDIRYAVVVVANMNYVTDLVRVCIPSQQMPRI